jgi:heme exporter protein CcmD
MMAVPHIGFILAAYAVTVVTVGGTMVAILLDRQALKRDLARYERHGRRGHAGGEPPR